MRLSSTTSPIPPYKTVLPSGLTGFLTGSAALKRIRSSPVRFEGEKVIQQKAGPKDRLFIVGSWEKFFIHSFVATLTPSNKMAGNIPPEAGWSVSSSATTWLNVSKIFPATIASFT